MSRTITPALGFGLLISTFFLAYWTAGQTPVEAHTSAEQHISVPKRIVPGSAAELETIFASHDFHWPPAEEEPVPSLVLTKIPGDFPDIENAQKRKALFLRALLPIVMLENRRIHEQRNLAQWLFNNTTLPAEDTEAYGWLTQLAKEMRVRGDLNDPQVQSRLLKRLDEIPPALALAQGAIESGWGTSRFALEGNSLFGQWTYKADKGLMPEDRDEDKTHLVASYPDLQASVRAYMRNLNTGRAYREFRDSRAAMREANQPLSPVELANHLRRYSQRGKEYVKELQVIINSRTLSALLMEQDDKMEQAAISLPLRLAALSQANIQ